jgi:glutamate---cysteine ligase / carboxylate-amine ligase
VGDGEAERARLDMPGGALPQIAPSLAPPGEGQLLGAEEEFHVVELATRSLVAQGPDVLAQLPRDQYSAELHRSVVESRSPVCNGLEELRASLVQSRKALADLAGAAGLGVVAAGSVPSSTRCASP